MSNPETTLSDGEIEAARQQLCAGSDAATEAAKRAGVKRHPRVPETIRLPQLHGWQFQPDQDAPGLYLQCATLAQRETIMRALGWYPGCPGIAATHQMGCNQHEH